MTKLSSQIFNFHERGWSTLNQDDFILDYFDKSWPELLRIDQQNVNLTMEFFLNKMNSIMDIHTSLQMSINID